MINPTLELSAESITAMNVAFGLSVITLFKPANTTEEVLKELSPGQTFYGVRLIDLFDNGVADRHINTRVHTVVGIFHAVGKEHTKIVTFSIQ